MIAMLLKLSSGTLAAAGWLLMLLEVNGYSKIICASM